MRRSQPRTIDQLLADFARRADSEETRTEIIDRVVGFLTTDRGRHILEEIAHATLAIVARTAAKSLKEQRREDIKAKAAQDFRKRSGGRAPHAKVHSSAIDELHNSENDRKRALQRFKQPLQLYFDDARPAPKRTSNRSKRKT